MAHLLPCLILFRPIPGLSVPFAMVPGEQVVNILFQSVPSEFVEHQFPKRLVPLLRQRRFGYRENPRYPLVYQSGYIARVGGHRPESIIRRIA